MHHQDLHPCDIQLQLAKKLENCKKGEKFALKPLKEKLATSLETLDAAIVRAHKKAVDDVDKEFKNAKLLRKRSLRHRKAIRKEKKHGSALVKRTRGKAPLGEGGELVRVCHRAVQRAGLIG